MADNAQSTVDSLLGHLSSVLLEEVKLLRGVRGDVRFIKSEMEIMNGFLLDLAKVDNPNNQVLAWRRQVRELATDFHNCVHCYVESLDARPPAAGGLLGCLQQVPQLLRTMLTRHRIATQIRELKSQACELGERRLRYGIKAPPTDAKPTDAKPTDAKEEDWRRALADVAEILEEDAREVIGWLTVELGDGDRRRPRLRIITITRTRSQEKEHSLAQSVFDHPCTSSWFEYKAWIKGVKETASRKEILQHVLQQLARAAAESKQEPEAGVATATGREQQLAGAAADSKREPGAGVATASGEEQQLARAAAESKQEPEAGVATATGREQQLAGAAADSKREPGAGVATASGEEQQLAGAAADSKREPVATASSWFDCKAWIEGVRKIASRMEIFQHVLEQLARVAADNKQEPGAGVATASGQEQQLDRAAGESKQEEQQLVEKIKDHLRGKRILIVAADDPSGLVRKEIESADAADDDGICYPGSAIIVTAEVFLELPESFVPYKSKDYTSPELFRRNARGLAGSVDPPKSKLIQQILQKCSRDFFCTEIFLRALYANPNTTKDELSNLLNSRFSHHNFLRFCYNSLLSHHKRCLLYLSIYPPDSEIRRTSLVRRWAAETLITKRGGKSEADESERCFNALVAWGLVRPVNIGAAGNVKSCNVHPHVLSFVAKEANASNTGLPPELAHRLPINSGIQLQERSKEDANAAKPPNTCWNWSICERLKGSKAPSNSTETLFESLQASSQSGLVKVLDLEGCEGLNKRHLRYICNNISLLRYLSLRKTGVDKLPREIEKLRYLETLDIRQTKVRAFATKSIVLRKLKHLLAGSINSPSEAFSTVKMPRGIRHMTDLQILSHVEVSNSEEELMDVGELHQLRKLGVVLCGKEAHINHLFQVIAKLNECLCSLSVQMVAQDETTHDFPEESATFSPPRSLVSLSINGRITGLPTWISELSQLSKITLRGTFLTDTNALCTLSSLDKLHCLRLRDESYMESTLTFKKGEFPSLRFLLVEGSEIDNIKFVRGAARRLEKITWSSTKMKAPPSGVKKLLYLKEIELSNNWDQAEVRGLISSIATHPNHPVVIHHQIREATAASSTSTPK